MLTQSPFGRFEANCRLGKRVRIGLSTALVLLLLVPSAARAENLQLGNMSYGRVAARPLARAVSVAPAFFRAVGGVAFDAVATGRGGLVVEDLKYVSGNPDGKRLVATVKSSGGQTQDVFTDIFDWELVPIARFAKSDEGSAMTLFGELESESLSREVLEAGGRIVNYHPALDNTLVGLRLFQADILVLQPNAADLFKRSGSYILGAGEAGHDLSLNQARFANVSAWLEDQAQDGHTYRSYVVGDLGQKVEFWVDKGRLAMSGDPYWFMWRDAPEVEEANRLREAVRILIAASEAAEKGEPSGLDQLEVLAANAVWSAYTRDGGTMETLVERLESINSATADVSQLEDFSRAASAKVAELDGINPIVYRTVTRVIRYRALFRHFFERKPAKYDRFLSSLDNVAVRPSVETPTIQYGVVH